MGDKSKIGWTESTWNPTTGCDKVSQGCKNCYAERLFPKVYGKHRRFTDVRTHEDRLDQPLRWRRPRRIFVNSMSDLFHEDVPDEFIDSVFRVAAICQQHQFQVLTKRPERMRAFFASQPPRRVFTTTTEHIVYSFPLPNVWLGISAEDQKTFDERWPHLENTPAAIRFVSLEPLLGPIETRPALTPIEGCANCGDGSFYEGVRRCCDEPLSVESNTIDWVIAGGESGPHARPSHPDWFRSLRDQCQTAGVKYFFKQWGEWEVASAANGHHDCSMASNRARWVHNDGLVNGPSWFRDDKREDTEPVGMIRVGKKAAGNLLDGRTWEEYPR